MCVTVSVVGQNWGRAQFFSSPSEAWFKTMLKSTSFPPYLRERGVEAFNKWDVCVPELLMCRAAKLRHLSDCILQSTTQMLMASSEITDIFCNPLLLPSPPSPPAPEAARHPSAAGQDGEGGDVHATALPRRQGRRVAVRETHNCPQFCSCL